MNPIKLSTSFATRLIGTSCAALLLFPTLLEAEITVFGSATGYQSTNKDWLTEFESDIDRNGLGTDGFIFFGDFDGIFAAGSNRNINPNNDDNGNIFADPPLGNNAGLFTTSQPSYVTTASTIGATTGNVGQFEDYEPIDSPVTLDGTDAVAGNLLVTGTGEAINFTISGLVPSTIVRVGVVTVLNDDDRGRFDIPTIGLTDGITTATVTGLPNLSEFPPIGTLGWVFFDIDSDGTYTILLPPDPDGIDPDVTGLGGVTFDSVIGDPTLDDDADNILDFFERALTASDDEPTGNLNDFDGTLIAGGGPGAATGDFDGDNLSDREEFELSTRDLIFPGLDPTDPDSDDDGFFDGAETNTGTFVSYDFTTNTGNTGTNPLNEDTDGDGLLDGVENGTGSFVDASATGSNPNLFDTDDDGFEDGLEVRLEGGDPNDGAVQPEVQTGYQATGADWVTEFADFDIGDDGQLGTDGYIFFGELGSPQAEGRPYFSGADNSFTGFESDPLPNYLVFQGPGADFTSIAWGFFEYGLIDDPNPAFNLDGVDVSGGIASSIRGGAGDSLELVEFDVSNLSPEQTVRVGILGGIEGDETGIFDPTRISLSGPNGYFEIAVGLEIDPGGDFTNAGWLFFDITDDGTYTISATRRADTGGASIGGVTFDSIGGVVVVGDDPPFAITSIEFDQEADMITVTWDSQPGATYSIDSSTDLITFGDEVESGIASGGEVTSLTFANPAVDGASRLFFRVNEFLEASE